MKKKLFAILGALLTVAMLASSCSSGTQKDTENESEEQETTAADAEDTSDTQEDTENESEEQETTAADAENTSDTTDDTSVPVYSRGLDENGYFEGVRALDYVTLPEYKGITISADLMVANEAEVQYQLDEVLAGYAEEITDPSATIMDGDTVNIDYVGSIDGVEFSGGSTGGSGTDVTIGVTPYIDDFLEQLIGHHPGDEFDIEVTFPEDYGKEDLNGKDAIFAITINYIHGDAELTDDIAIEYGFDSKEALLADLEEWVINSARFNKFMSIAESAEVSEVPQSVIDYLIALDEDMFAYYASMYGISVEEYIMTFHGSPSMDAYVEVNMDVYTEDAKFYLAAQAIAEAEGLVATSEDVTESGYDSYIADMGEPYIKQYVLLQNIIPEFIALNGIVE